MLLGANVLRSCPKLHPNESLQRNDDMSELQQGSKHVVSKDETKEAGSVNMLI